MPIATIQLFPGRDSTVKEFVARNVCDTVSEHTGISRDGVEVIFEEIDRSNWAPGPASASIAVTTIRRGRIRRPS